jgi:glycosyltransferase involved in cell wall biosynthesis
MPRRRVFRFASTIRKISNFKMDHQSEMENQPLVSVIVPVYNASQYLERCIAAINCSIYPSYEVIVIDDASTDESSKIARKLRTIVLELPYQSGPAKARNYGAKKAQGDILLFVDSDVLIKKDTIARIVDNFIQYSDISAIFGSYDKNPSDKNFFSQYKNLLHHFVHQMSSPDAVTFWAGCGAVRKEVFNSVGGFDHNKYSKPSIEDIEMGYRLKKMGYQILLDKNLQVTHLKKWTFTSLMRADIFQRAIPWTKLILESQEMVSDLNLQISQKISAGLVGLFFISLLFSFIFPDLIYLIPFLLSSVLLINYKLFHFFYKCNGAKFTLLAFAMHLFYFFYSGTSFIIFWLRHKLRNKMNRLIVTK